MESDGRAAPGWNFGPFELDTCLGELRSNGKVIPLQHKPLQVLIFLVENAGHPVTRDEIRQRLWAGDTFIEFDDSLNQAVRKVREALGDPAGHPRFIKTLHRRGYQFLAPVQIARADLPADSPSTAGAARRIWSLRLLLLILLASAVWFAASGIVRLTTFAGSRRHLLSEDARKTLGPAPWSPDGRRLLFARFQPNGHTAIWAMDIGTNRQWTVTVPPAGSDDRFASYSFDGKWIAFIRRTRGHSDLWVLPAEGGEPMPLLRDISERNDPAFSPDSRRIVFHSNRSGPQNMWEIDIVSRVLMPGGR